MMFWLSKLSIENENHSDDKLYVLKFKHIFSGKEYDVELTAQDVMERDYGKRNFDKRILKNAKNKRNR